MLGMWIGGFLFSKNKKKINLLLHKGLFFFPVLLILSVLLILLCDEKELYYSFKFFSPLFSIGSTFCCIYCFMNYVPVFLTKILSKCSIGVYAVYLFHEFFLTFFSNFSKSLYFGLSVGILGSLGLGFLMQYYYDKGLAKCRNLTSKN